MQSELLQAHSFKRTDKIKLAPNIMQGFPVPHAKLGSRSKTSHLKDLQKWR